MDAGSRLRVRGEGNVGRRGGEPGDLYVFINVRAHPAGLRREGTTIHSDVDVSYVDAILGTTVKARPVCLAPWLRCWLLIALLAADACGGCWLWSAVLGTTVEAYLNRMDPGRCVH